MSGESDGTVTVHVWQGDRTTTYDDLLTEDPDVYEVPVPGVEHGKCWETTDGERVFLAEDVKHHGTYAFDVPNADRPATVNVHTNANYHNPEDWGDPVERGLGFLHEDDADPFKVELWGRVMLWVEVPDA